jgi:hypothetical protein
MDWMAAAAAPPLTLELARGEGWRRVYERELDAFDRLRARHPELLLHLSTDSTDIAASWPEADRPTRLRPAALARDDTSSIAVVEHELAACAAAGQARRNTVAPA